MPERYDITQVREKLKRQKTNRGRIQKAAKHEERLRLHSALSLSEVDTNCRAAVRDFLTWVKDTLRKPDKYDMFCHLLRFPVPTVSLTSEIFGALEKVYDGRNPVHTYDFAVPEIEEDYLEYRKEKKLNKFFRYKAWAAFKERINSIVVVDLPDEQTGASPEPYAYILDINNVHDYEYEDGKFEWICYKEGKEKLIWIDETSYKVFLLKEGGIEIEIADVLIDVEHGLGYTPAFFTWSDAISDEESDIKQSPLTAFLGDLDWLLFYEVSKKHLDLYASYPIFWGFEQDCDYRHEETGEYCAHGWIHSSIGDFVINRDTGGLKPCPACSDRRLIGAGTFVQVPAPDPENGIGDTRNPVGVIPAEVQSLEYNVKEVSRLKKAIFEGTTGHGGAIINDQAANEMQIESIIDAKKSMLFNLKKNLEKLQSNVEETICRLRYGAAFRGVTINYGTEFHLLTPADARKAYEEAKTNGADAATLDALQEEYIVSRYRHDPMKLQREKILCNLDPFRHRTISEVQGLMQAGIIAPEEYYLKFNFSTLIAKFEREQANLTTFGEALPFDTRIERIKTILLQYASAGTTKATESSSAQTAGAGQV